MTTLKIQATQQSKLIEQRRKRHRRILKVQMTTLAAFPSMNLIHDSSLVFFVFLKCRFYGTFYLGWQSDFRYLFFELTGFVLDPSFSYFRFWYCRRKLVSVIDVPYTTLNLVARYRYGTFYNIFAWHSAKNKRKNESFFIEFDLIAKIGNHFV